MHAYIHVDIQTDKWDETLTLFTVHESRVWLCGCADWSAVNKLAKLLYTVSVVTSLILSTCSSSLRSAVLTDSACTMDTHTNHTVHIVILLLTILALLLTSVDYFFRVLSPYVMHLCSCCCNRHTINSAMIWCDMVATLGKSFACVGSGLLGLSSLIGGQIEYWPLTAVVRAEVPSSR